jgi:hypothetical protein
MLVFKTGIFFLWAKLSYYYLTSVASHTCTAGNSTQQEGKIILLLEKMKSEKYHQSTSPLQGDRGEIKNPL